ncbi:(2Fe-2S) ferredoxin domain-containing protein [Aggregatilinea lenta]|uniref:(2Fe-2S) ferredoxin domain-containing protein n=1 Tax=Aggregatilinea lenta TaxID=913108 RepID=UPI000E5AA912|nr:(2Fe-2S) ferredoxin domain-containing protein [Aggregatilinea lenta]
MQKTVLYLCVGSACHQYGAYKIRFALEDLLAEGDLADRVELKGAFCLGPCMDGVALKVDGEIITRVRPENLEQKFRDEIVPRLR